MVFLSLFFQRIKVFPHFIVLFVKDVYKYFKEHENKHFHLWGLHIYLGKFGQGKTSTMVRDAYNLCCRYEDVTVLTNLKLTNFPNHTKILELKSIQDILNAPDNTIVLIDEIGTIFNSRDFQQNQRKGKGDEPEGLPKVLFQHICQVRHRHMVIFGTVQRWGFLEKQLREITNDVTVCSAFPSHPFSRIITNYCYDAEEYNLFYQSPLRPLVPLTGDVWIQTDKLRALYNTKEMVNTMLKMDYVSDEETERNRAFEALGLAAPMDKKTENKLRRNVRNK